MTVQQPKELLVLGAGLPCTGNTTLKTALDMLGYRVTDSNSLVDDSSMMDLWSRLAYEYWLENGSDFVYQIDWSQDSKYNAVVGLPLSLFYKEISKQYPNCKVILTVRTHESQWLDSLHSSLLNFHFGVQKRLFFQCKWNIFRYLISLLCLGQTYALDALEKISSLSLFMLYHECVDFDIFCSDKVFRYLSDDDDHDSDDDLVGYSKTTTKVISKANTKEEDINKEDNGNESDSSSSSDSESRHSSDDEKKQRRDDSDDSSSESGSLLPNRPLFGRPSDWNPTARKRRRPQLNRADPQASLHWFIRWVDWFEVCCLRKDEMSVIMNTEAVPLSDEQWLRFYDIWMADAIDFFSSNQESDRLLVYDVSKGWRPLCQFLGKECPNVDFPHSNARYRRQSWQSMIWWFHFIADVFVVTSMVGFCYLIYLFLILINIIR